MEEKEKKKMNEGQHQLTLVNRGFLNIDGVKNLGSYDQEVVYIETDYGTLEIKGSGLHIQQLNLDQGKLMIDGDIQSFVYQEEGMQKKGKGFFGRLMK
jgi:sporulation protein YabP